MNAKEISCYIYNLYAKRAILADELWKVDEEIVRQKELLQESSKRNSEIKPGLDFPQGHPDFPAC